MSALIEELLLISSKDFKEWLKAHYFKKHKLHGALRFDNLGQGHYTCRYIVSRPSIIAFEIEVELITDDVIRVKIEPLDHPVSDPNIVLDYASEMIATAIEEEFEPAEQSKKKSLERQFIELGVLELGEQGEENIIRFLLKRHETQQKQADRESLFRLRCQYMAAKGNFGILQLLLERNKARELELLERELRNLYEECHYLELEEAKSGGELSLRLTNQKNDNKEQIEIKEKRRQELKS